MAWFTFKRYTGDPDPLPTEAQAASLNRPEPFEYLPDTPTSGVGHTFPAFVPSVNVPIVGASPAGRSNLALMAISFAHVKIGQAGGARRLFPTNKVGAFNQSPTIQAQNGQRIVRPSAGPWDRGGAVGGS